MGIKGQSKASKPKTPKGSEEMVAEAVGRWKSNGERSAYFARREAAKVLGSVLEGDARRQAVGSIKSLIYRPCIRNKKATFALVCQTLKRMFFVISFIHSFSTS